MTSAAAAAQTQRTGGRQVADRLAAALPLLALYTWLALVYAWQAWLTPSPSIFPDELQYAELARAIAETGQPALRGVDEGAATLPAYLTAAAWLLDETADAYLAAKTIGVIAMAAVVFPAYALARLVAPRGPALWVAAAAATIPALSYSALLMEEPFAYPAATTAFWLVVRAARRPSRRAVALAALACVAVPLVRRQLVLVPAVAALAGAWVALGSERGRRVRARLGRRRLAMAGAALVPAVVAAHLGLRELSLVWQRASAVPGDTLEYAVWSLGALALGLAVLPFVVALAASASGGGGGAPEWRALVALLVASLVAFPLYAGAKVAYLAPTWTAPVEERNVIYLAPLVLAATAPWLARPRLPALTVLGAAAATVALLRLTPTILSLPYFEAPGFSFLAGLHQDVGLTAAAARDAEVVLAAASALVALLAARVAWGRRLAATAAAVVLAALVAGELWASAEQRRLATEIRDDAAQPLAWLDERANGRPVAYLGREIRNVNGLWTLEFWNESVREVATLGGAAPPPGPGLAASVVSADGTVAPAPATPLVVTDAELVPEGTLAAVNGRWRLYAPAAPLRLREDVEGVDADGWAGAFASFTRFTPAPGRVVEVAVSRTAWSGPSPRGAVAVRLGPIGIGPGGGAFLAGIDAERHGSVGSGESAVFRLPTPAGPFRVEVVVEPTFVPAEVDREAEDTRALGAQLAFRVTRQ